MKFVVNISVLGFGLLYFFFSLALKTWNMMDYPSDSVIAFGLLQAGIILMSAIVNYLIIGPEKPEKEIEAHYKAERDGIISRMNDKQRKYFE